MYFTKSLTLKNQRSCSHLESLPGFTFWFSLIFVLPQGPTRKYFSGSYLIFSFILCVFQGFLGFFVVFQGPIFWWDRQYFSGSYLIFSSSGRVRCQLYFHLRQLPTNTLLISIFLFHILCFILTHYYFYFSYFIFHSNALMIGIFLF